jgi:hypothetical protein
MKTIQLIFFSLLMWFLVYFTVGAATVPWLGAVAGVVAVAGVWGFGIYKAIEQGRRIERLRAAAVQARQEADEKQAIADRMAEEEYTAWQEAHRARARMETRAVMRGFINPN